jgi:[glutamine synthetase] adenylyltransferase / [glutamine synthetase]-adenylyl-L-tyrosine phosphorylase
VAGADAYEDVLDMPCGAGRSDRQFQTGVQFLRGVVDAAAAGSALSDIADAADRAALPASRPSSRASTAAYPRREFALLALGKLGGREMTATSDLDLVFVYDRPPASSSPTARSRSP